MEVSWTMPVMLTGASAMKVEFQRLA